MIKNCLSDIFAVQWKRNVEGFLEHVKDYVSKGLKKHGPRFSQAKVSAVIITFDRPVCTVYSQKYINFLSDDHFKKVHREVHYSCSECDESFETVKLGREHIKHVENGKGCIYSLDDLQTVYPRNYRPPKSKDKFMTPDEYVKLMLSQSDC